MCTFLYSVTYIFNEPSKRYISWYLLSASTFNSRHLGVFTHVEAEVHHCVPRTGRVEHFCHLRNGLHGTKSLVPHLDVMSNHFPLTIRCARSTFTPQSFIPSPSPILHHPSSFHRPHHQNPSVAPHPSTTSRCHPNQNFHTHTS